MGNCATTIKIIVGLIVLAIIAVASGQTRVTNETIVSDKAVAPADTIRIVDKNEIQRIVDKRDKADQELVNRVIELESITRDLENRITELEGG
jgi:hypothetical protein